MNRNRIGELDFLKGLSILGVLVLHSSFAGRFNQQTMVVQAIMMRFFDWAVLGFFFSSGFLHDRSVPFLTTFKKRFVALMVPFFLYNLFYNLCFWGIAVTGLAPVGTLELTHQSLFSGLFWSPGFQLYFLPYLLLISVGISGLEKLGGGRYQWAYGGLLLLIAAFYFVRGYPAISNGSDVNKLPMYLAMYLIGILYQPLFKLPGIKMWMIAVTLVAVLTTLVCFRFGEVSLLVPPLLLALAGVCPPLWHGNPLLRMGEMSGSI